MSNIVNKKSIEIYELLPVNTKCIEILESYENYLL
jgi:hypothetical protein